MLFFVLLLLILWIGDTRATTLAAARQFIARDDHKHHRKFSYNRWLGNGNLGDVMECNLSLIADKCCGYMRMLWANLGQNYGILGVRQPYNV
jgi:uncharacterized protein (DUF2342 family)